MLYTAHIRDIYGEIHPTEILDPVAPNVHVANVPGFGHVMIGPGSDGEDSVNALLIHRRGSTARTALRMEDNTIEVEVLPNSSGEDRVVVVFTPQGSG